MTYKEKLMEYDPDSVNPRFAGGCAGCPGDYFMNAPTLHINCILPETDIGEKCVLCWNRKYKGEEEYVGY